jgi:hypothetical protein
MRCRHCQQDVPAVARSVEGPLVCPRCDEEFETEVSATTDFARACAYPTDTGVSLDSVASKCDLAPPINFLEQEETHRHLRRIGRRLRTAYRHDPGFASAPPLSWGPEAPTGVAPLRAVARRGSRTREDSAKPTIASRLIELLLMAGVVGFIGGAGLLVWAAAFGLPEPWQWGMTTTIAAEGALILGLTWMAGRLWRNSRRINRQLEGVEGQLDHIERLTGSLANSRMSCSQHYYDHFSQGASSQMLLANLRGQVDQLAERMAGRDLTG